jgi:hypothetical protein
MRSPDTGAIHTLSGLEFPGPVKSGFGAISASTGLQPVGHFHAVGPTDNRTGTDRLATVVQCVATGFNWSQLNLVGVG